MQYAMAHETAFLIGCTNNCSRSVRPRIVPIGAGAKKPHSITKVGLKEIKLLLLQAVQKLNIKINNLNYSFKDLFMATEINNQKLSFAERFSAKVTKASGSTAAICIAFGLVLLWALLGPVFNYSENWQLVINT